MTADPARTLIPIAALIDAPMSSLDNCDSANLSLKLARGTELRRSLICLS
ncbi:hypothetical protein HanPSC8_Chr04g0169041 [Helianthus annuus]|nr:hypothetical protein HanPSC8_Chr04g0169041 [Helianthus annuus]